MNSRLVVFMVVGALALAGAPLSAEPPAPAANVIVNGDFHTDVSGGWWPGNAFFPVTWVAGPILDAFGSPSSGSMRLQVNSTVDFANGGTYQCLTASAATTYDFGAWIRMPSTNTCGPSPCEASANVSFYDAPGCSGNQLGPIVFTARLYSDGSGGTLDTWHLRTAQAVSPAGTVSTMFYLNVLNSQDNGIFTAYFDGVRFGPTPATPVELTGFAAE